MGAAALLSVWPAPSLRAQPLVLLVLGVMIALVGSALGTVTPPAGAGQTTEPRPAPGCQGEPVDDALGDLCPDDEQQEEYDVEVTGDLGSGAVVEIAPNGIPACDHLEGSEFRPLPCYTEMEFEIPQPPAAGSACAFADSYDVGSDRPAGRQGQVDADCHVLVDGGYGSPIYLPGSAGLGFHHWAGLLDAGCSDRFNAVYHYGGPSEATWWSARGPEALTCTMSRSARPDGTDTTPDGLYGPTWVGGKVTLMVAKEDRPDLPYWETSYIWIPVDGEERDRGPIVRASVSFDYLGTRTYRFADDSSAQWGHRLDYDWTFEITDNGQTQDERRLYATSNEKSPEIFFTEGDWYRATLKITDTVNGLAATTTLSGRIWTNGEDPPCPGATCPGEPVVTLSASDTSASERGPDPGAWTLERTDATGELTVNVSESGSATSGSDYQVLSPTVAFGEGEGSVEVPLVPLDDRKDEPVETVRLTLAEGDGYTIGDPSTGEIAIRSDDRRDTTAPKIKVGSAKQSNTKRVRVAVRCNERCAVTVGPKGKAAVKNGPPGVPKRVILRMTKAKATLAAGKKRQLALKFKGAKAKKLVRKVLRRKRGKVTIKLRATAVDRAGNTGRATATVMLR